MARVTFELEPNAWHGHATERLWAERVGSDTYRLRNSPFYAKNVSFGDIVTAEQTDDGQLLFTGTALRGGHSTYRIVPAVAPSTDRFTEFWAPLRERGCSYEGVEGKLLSADVPPRADIHEVYRLLQAGEDAGVWDFEEGHCGHPLRG